MPNEQQAPRRIPLATPIIRQRVTPWGHALSFVVHALVLAGAVWAAQKGAEALQSPGEGEGSGGGGGGSRVFAVLLPQRAAATPPPQPDPAALTVPVTVKPLDSIIPPAAADSAPSAAPPSTGEGAGAGKGEGPGTGPGSGGGTGGGSGGGVGADSGGGGGRVFPPQLQGMLIPPMENRPGNLRGVQLLVQFEIDERGQVLDVTTDPEIRDRGYRNRFMDQMRRYTFTPARLDGRAVRGRFEARIRL